jgi:hypothetical protein
MYRGGTTLFFAFSVVLHLMLLLLIYPQLYIPTTRQIVFTAWPYRHQLWFPSRFLRHHLCSAVCVQKRRDATAGQVPALAKEIRFTIRASFGAAG